MNPIKIIVSSVIVVFAVIAIIAYLYRQKRKMRKGELRNHVNQILHPDGCSNAMHHFDEAIHISTYYGIPMEEVGYHHHHDQLRADAVASIQRAVALAEKTWQGFTEPATAG